jgi:uncharacterized protein (DUF924 family)
MTTIQDVLGFWFGEPARSAGEFGAKMKRWYRGGPEEDAALRARFAAAVERALAGELDAWSATPRGRLALVLLLDQMTRSLHRGTARAFAGDPAAQRLALAAFELGATDGLDFEQRHFFYMPLLHAESAVLLDTFNVLFPASLEQAPEWARPLLADGVEQGAKYRALIERFGRFPHRNAALGRRSTPEELAFLATWEQRASPKTFAALFGSPVRSGCGRPSEEIAI